MIIICVFFLLFLLNYRDEVKAEIAALFFWLALLGEYSEFGGINFYLIGMAAPAVVILFCNRTHRNWSLLVSLIMTSSILINFIGMLWYMGFPIHDGESLYMRATYLTTFAEIAVLLIMPSRLLDGYFTDNLRRVRQYFAGLLSVSVDHNPRLQRV